MTSLILFVIKLTTAVAGAGWLAYNIIVKAYISAVQSLIQFLSSVIAIIKDRLLLKKDGK